MVSVAMLCKSWNHGLWGHYGAMTVAAAPDWRSFAQRAGRADHGGLQ
jgi:hypothetical protein